jgi:nicotinamidase/pyrazinamidase
MMSTALILVDLQNDFLPGGALAVPDGDAVISVANRLIREFDLIVATQDWHPPDHISFAATHPGRQPYDVVQVEGAAQTLWPVHCVQWTGGACLAPALNTTRITRVFPKGTDRSIDSYSGFFDNGHRRATGLAEWLRGRGVSELVICGLATDYCVRATALDAISEGFRVRLIEDGCRGVNVSPGDDARAVEEMERAGVAVANS